MVLDAVSNFVRGSTDAAVGTSDTTVSVADASIFPDPATDGEFNVVIWDVNNFPRPDQDGDVEILRVTERDTTADELTVTRGQEMTSAAAHPEGSAIHLSPTAKMFSDIESTFGDFWDAGTQELTADVNNTNTTTEALEAEELNNGSARVFRELETGSVDGGDSITIDGFSLESTTGTFKEYWLHVDCLSKVGGDVTLQVNGLVGDYEFFDESGTRHTSQDEFYLFEDDGGTSDTVVAGWIKISDPASTPGSRWAILNNLTFGRRVSGYSQRGGVDEFNDITSISINLAGADEDNEINVSVFEVTPNV